MPSRAGSPNRSKTALIKLLQDKYPGYQPVLDMAEAAHALSASARSANEADAPPLWRDANAAHDKVAQYVTPKLKAVEVTGNDGGPIRWASMTDDDLEAYAKQIAEEIGIS